MMDRGTLDTEPAEELEELLAETDDPGPGVWLQDLDAIERDSQNAGRE